jgi:hypothetical protein
MTTRALTRWRPRWRLARWTVFVEEWQLWPLDGIAATTGRYFECSPLTWAWIGFLRLLLASRRQSVRVWAARRWRSIVVTYYYPEGSQPPDFRAQPVIGGWRPDRRRLP